MDLHSFSKHFEWNETIKKDHYVNSILLKKRNLESLIISQQSVRNVNSISNPVNLLT